MLVIFGQDLTAQKNAFLTVNIGPQRTMFINSDDYKYDGIVENFPTYAYTYRAIFSQNINSRIGLDYGFGGSRVEQEFKIYAYKGSVSAISSRKSNLYVNIPLLLRMDLVSTPKNILFFSAGPQLSILMSEDGIVPVYYDHSNVGVPSDTTNAFDISEASGAYRKFSFAVAGSFGWNTKMYKNIFLQVLLKTDYTLTDVENKSYDTLFLNETYHNLFLLFNKDRPATHIFTLGLGIGIAFKLR